MPSPPPSLLPSGMPNPEYPMYFARLAAEAEMKRTAARTSTAPDGVADDEEVDEEGAPHPRMLRRLLYPWMRPRFRRRL